MALSNVMVAGGSLWAMQSTNSGRALRDRVQTVGGGLIREHWGAWLQALQGGH